MHESDRNGLLKRQRALLLALLDMSHAGAALQALERESANVDLMRALETAIAVSYARAFTASSLLRLGKDEYRPSDPTQAQWHDELISLRDTVYAHTDKDSGRTAQIEVTAATGIGNLGGLPMSFAGRIHEQWNPIPRHATLELRFLFEAQALRFTAEAVDIEMQLTNDDASNSAHTVLPSVPPHDEERGD
jgi:hypothetical protein